MEKPIFDHTAHKAIWGILSKCPDKTKMQAVLELGYDPDDFLHQCPACEAVAGRTGEENIGGRGSCRSDCPLDLGTMDCIFGEHPLSTVFLEARCFEDAAKIAEKMRDLPLKKNAHDMYEII